MQSIDDRRAVMQSEMQSVDDRRTAIQFGQCCQAQMQSAEVRVCQVVNMNSDQFNIRCRDTNKWEYWKLNVGIPTFSQCLVQNLETVKLRFPQSGQIRFPDVSGMSPEIE